MSVFELFRRFFHPPGLRDPFFGGMTHDEEEDDELFSGADDDELFSGADDDELFSAQDSASRFRHFHDPFGFEDFFRDFNELFTDFGSMIRDVPRLPGIAPPARSPGRSGTGSLRDFMLKFPDSHLPREQTPPSRGPGTSEGPDPPRWRPSREDASVPPGDTKQDRILDSEVSSRGLDSVLRAKEPSSSPPSSSSSYFRSVSVSKVLRPDGTVEERRTVRDSDGNTTTTVTRGDQVIGSIHPSRGAPVEEKDSARIPHGSLPDLSDSQSILSRILHRWFSD